MLLSSADRNYIPNSQLTYYFSAAEKWFQISCLTSPASPEKAANLLDSGKVKVEPAVKEKTLTMSQQILQHVSGIQTPLGIATAHYVFNQTLSKSLITLNNRLGQKIR